MKTTKVRELMTTEVIKLDKQQAIPLAQELMRMTRVRHLPVVSERGELVGMVTHRSLLGAQVEMLSQMASDEEAEQELTIPVAKVMTTKVQTVGPDALVSEALKKMLDARQGVVVVIEENKIVGVLTSQDFLSLMLESPEPVSAPPEQLAKLAASEAVSRISATMRPGPATAPRWIVWLLLGLVGLLALALLLPRASSTLGSRRVAPAAAGGHDPALEQGGPSRRAPESPGTAIQAKPTSPARTVQLDPTKPGNGRPASQPAHTPAPAKGGVRPHPIHRRSADARREANGPTSALTDDTARAAANGAGQARPIPPGQQLPLPEDVGGRIPNRQRRWIPEPVNPPR